MCKLKRHEYCRIRCLALSDLDFEQGGRRGVAKWKSAFGVVWWLLWTLMKGAHIRIRELWQPNDRQKNKTQRTKPTTHSYMRRRYYFIEFCVSNVRLNFHMHADAYHFLDVVGIVIVYVCICDECAVKSLVWMKSVAIIVFAMAIFDLYEWRCWSTIKVKFWLNILNLPRNAFITAT